MLKRVEEELPSASDVAKADDIELQEITEKAATLYCNLKWLYSLRKCYPCTNS